MKGSRGLILFTGIFLTMLGLVGIIVSAVMGEMEVYLIIIIPVIVLKGVIPVLSFIILMSGLLLLIIFVTLRRELHLSLSDMRGVEGGGIIFLGPIPIVFGSRSFKRNIIPYRYLIVIGLAFFLLLLVLYLMFVGTIR